MKFLYQGTVRVLCYAPAGDIDCTQVLMEFLTPLISGQLQINVITQSQHSTWWYCFDWTWTPFVVDYAGATVTFPP